MATRIVDSSSAAAPPASRDRSSTSDCHWCGCAYGLGTWIIALRQLGMPLREIAQTLDGDVNDLADKIKAEVHRETDPADQAAQALTRQWDGAMHEMTGGDRRMVSAIHAKIGGKGPEAATNGILDTEVRRGRCGVGPGFAT
ncbi:MerR family transcriptional regulator [Actinomadura rudentiformis]|uniref:Uncharacterized protein n=1 Tax=Actinomadura rudentiformis TaxID=359158 RepID=A0A6H9Z4V2_9ACTN|nr:hypothetical protein [Actinomadura rudentiformis]KAB2349689.1 hypothetical protein F8566_13115 [Actinomadura rudentiformis]